MTVVAVIDSSRVKNTDAEKIVKERKTPEMLGVCEGYKHIMYASGIGKDIENDKNDKNAELSHLTKTWADIVETSSFTFPACLKEMNMNKPKVF